MLGVLAQERPILLVGAQVRVMPMIMAKGGHVLATGQVCASLEVSYKTDSQVIEVTGSHNQMANLTAIQEGSGSLKITLKDGKRVINHQVSL